jgi:hypothetical protein
LRQTKTENSSKQVADTRRKGRSSNLFLLELNCSSWLLQLEGRCFWIQKDCFIHILTSSISIILIFYLLDSWWSSYPYNYCKISFVFLNANLIIIFQYWIWDYQNHIEYHTYRFLICRIIKCQLNNNSLICRIIIIWLNPDWIEHLVVWSTIAGDLHHYHHLHFRKIPVDMVWHFCNSHKYNLRWTSCCHRCDLLQII